MSVCMSHSISLRPSFSKSTRYSCNQSVKRSINPSSIGQSVSQSVSIQSVSLYPCLSICMPVRLFVPPLFLYLCFNQSFNQSIMRSINQSWGQSISHSENHSIEQPISLSISRSIFHPVTTSSFVCLSHHLSVNFVCLYPEHWIIRSINQSINQSIDRRSVTWSVILLVCL